MGNGAHEHCSLHWLRPPATQANKLYANISSTTLVWAPCGQMQSKHPILGFTLGSRTKVSRVLYFWVKLQTTNERYTIKYQQTCRSIHSRTLAALLQITVEPSSATQHLTLQGKEHLRQLEYPARVSSKEPFTVQISCQGIIQVILLQKHCKSTNNRWHLSPNG